MTLDEMLEAMKTQGYSYEMIAEQIGFGKERVKEALSTHEPPWDYNVLIALTHYFEKRDSKQNAVSESMAYHVEKQQGDYTIADYYALPEDWNAELIDGVIYKYNTPTTTHQIIAFQMAYQIEHYIETQEGDCIPFLSPVGVQLDCDEQTMVQPDVIILCNKDKNINRCIYGAPDFVAEVLSPATRRNDLGIKLDKYANAGVQEYWIIDPNRAQVIVHLFQKDSDKKVIDDVTIYGFTDQIPVYIYGEKLKIDFAKISRKIETVFPHYFEKRDSKQNVVSESMAYHVEKQQGDYTIADYYALPDDFRAELIDGILYDMAAPTLFHQGIASEVYRQLANYIRDKKGKCIPFLAPADVQLNQDDYTMIQPDVFLVCRKGFIDRKCLHGAPDWVMEVVSPSTKSKDLILKLNQYKTAGVREYWIVDPEKETVIVHDFANSHFPRDYTFEDVIPMGIYRGDFKMDMAEISTYLKHFFVD